MVSCCFHGVSNFIADSFEIVLFFLFFSSPFSSSKKIHVCLTSGHWPEVPGGILRADQRGGAEETPGRPAIFRMFLGSFWS